MSRRDNIKDVAESIPFDNDSNDFDADNLQAAPEEIDFRQVTFEPTGFEDRASSEISFNDGTRTFTIAAVSGTFGYYIRGHRFERSSDSIQLPNIEGLWHIYYEGDTLKALQTEWEFDAPTAFVAIAYWDADNDKAIYFGDERHGLVMDWRTHEYLHQVYGAQVELSTFQAGNYILSGDGTLDAHARLSIGDGKVHDEDLILEIKNSASPSQPFEQRLSTIAYIPVYYRDGASGVWRKLDATQFPLAYDTGGGLARYNAIVGGSWSLVNATSGYIVASWIFATNNINEPIIAVCGQMQSLSLSGAASDDFFGNLDLSGFPFVEACLLYRIFFVTSTLYTNTPKAILGAIDGLLTPNNVPVPVVNYRIASSVLFSTTSTTDVLVTGMSVTPQAGTYAVWFNSNIVITQNNQIANISLYRAGVQVVDSERAAQGVSSNFETQSSTLTTVTVDGMQTIDVRARITSGALTINGRTLLFIRLGV